MKKHTIILLLSAIVLFPAIATAQFFEHDKVVVWDVKDDIAGKTVHESTKEEIRISMVSAFANSENYEAFNIVSGEIKSYAEYKYGKGPKNIAKAIRDKYPNVDYVIFTTIKMLEHSDAAEKNKIMLSSDFFDVNELEIYRTNYVEMPTDLRAIPGACAELLSKLLHEEISAPETPMQYNPAASSTAASQPFDGYIETAYGLNMKMIRVEGGTFTMGATSEQGDDFDNDERPTHDVELSEYYISECEITQAQWQAIMGNTIAKQRDKVNPSAGLYGVGANYPMYFVSYYDALEFCNRLNRITGRVYTLPTEAQWEYAARGGKYSRKYKYSGFNQIGIVAWHKGNSASSTHPVGQLRGNELGIKDMTGNVWEWCRDYYQPYTYEFQKDPMCGSGKSIVLRGGSFGKVDRECRVSYRLNADPSKRDMFIGFRVVCLP